MITKPLSTFMKDNKIFINPLPENPRPSGLGCRGKKSDCLIYYTIIKMWWFSLKKLYNN